MANGIHDTNTVKKIVGGRLKAARENVGCSRQEAVDRIAASSLAPVFEKHPTLGIDRYKKWEYGENPIEIEWLPAICEVYNCDVGYLFGEYQEYTKDRQRIRDKTKLSKNAVDWLLKNKVENPHLVNTLNELFEYDGIADELFSSIFEYALSHFSHIIVSDNVRGKKEELSLSASERMLKYSVQECFSSALDKIRQGNHKASMTIATMRINKLEKDLKKLQRD